MEEIRLKLVYLATTYGIDPEKIVSIEIDRDYDDEPRLVIAWKRDG